MIATGATVNPERGVAPGLTLDVRWDHKEYMHVVYKTTTATTTRSANSLVRESRQTRVHVCARASISRMSEDFCAHRKRLQALG